MVGALVSSRVVALFIAFLMGLLACFATGLSLYGYYASASDTLNNAAKQADALAKTLSTQFQTAQSLIDSRLPDLESNPAEANAWLEALHQAVAEQQDVSVLSFGLAFEPYAYAPEQRLYAPMYLRAQAESGQGALKQWFGTAEDKFRGLAAVPHVSADDRTTGIANTRYNLVPLHEVVDYTLPYKPEDPSAYDSSWYQLGLSAPQDKGLWQQPYFGEILQSMLSEYSRPFFGVHPVTGQRQKLGMVYIDLSLEDVRETVQNLDLPPGAYGVLLSDEARVVSHPIRGWLGNPLSETLAMRQPTLAQQIIDQVRQGDSFSVAFKDPISGQAFTAVHRSVPNNRWSFGLTLAKESLYNFTQHQRLLLLIGGFALGAMVLAITVAKAIKASDLLGEGWRISNIAVVWTLTLSFLALGLFVQMEETGDYLKLLNPTDLRVLTKGASGQGGDEPIQIPTGISLEEIKFSRHDEITLSGLIWQVVEPTVADDVLGLVFSGSQLDKTRTEKVFEYARKGEKVHGWRFTTTLRHTSNVGRYPFDKSLIRLALAPIDRQANVILIPDFKAYDLMVPNALPGIDPGLRLKYWNVRSSFFAKADVYSFGLGAAGLQKLSLSDNQLNNTLVFNVALSRKWLSPIVAYVLPIFIGSIMIFIVLMIPNDRSSGVVFSTLSYGSTIYFVISIFHVGLRNSEGIDGLTYLESYYIIMHAMVMLVSLNGFLLMLNKGPSWLFYRDNAVPRMLYWPTITFGLLLMTALYFVVPGFLSN